MEQKTLTNDIIIQKSNNKHLSSVFYNEQELLRAIIDIHCETEIELDPMYNKGMFYKTGNIQQPLYKFDLEPIEGVKIGNATNLIEINSNSINTMILDPPFLFGIHGKTKENVCSKRYTIIPNLDELKKLYIGIIKESLRVLKKGGILIFKCQDYTDSKTTMTHCFVYQWALDNGFYAKDLCLLVKENKIFNPNLKQRHFRKVHSYFWIFQKLNSQSCPECNLKKEGLNLNLCPSADTKLTRKKNFTVEGSPVKADNEASSGQDALENKEMKK